MRLDLLGLEAFLAIAERGSFSAAATHLNLSQTALSHRLRKLEEQLGVRLIARTTRQIALTPAGVELLPRGRKLIDEMSAAFDGIRQQASRKEARVAIGCVPTIAAICLPRALAQFRQHYPETRVRIFDNSATEIAERVQSGDAAFGITVTATNRWDLDLRPLAKEPFVLVCHRDLPLAQRNALTWADVETLPLVRISAETGNRILIDDALGARRESLRWHYEVQRITTAMSLVRAGIGYAVVPKLAYVLEPDPALAAVPLGEPMVERTICVMTRKGLTLEPSAQLLLDHISRILSETIARQNDPDHGEMHEIHE